MNTSDHQSRFHFDLQFIHLKKKERKKEMAGHGQDIRYKAGDITGQAQVNF